jgi:transcription antitermination factor NusG
VPLLQKEPDLFPADLFATASPRGDWWVARVRSRQEKRLARHFVGQEVAYYLPQQEKSVRREGRIRTSFLPLFPGYVFYRGAAAERLRALQSGVVVHVLEVVDQDRLQRELADLARLQASGLPLVPHAWLGPGDEVEIADGPFAGYFGRVLREAGRLQLVLSVSMLRRAVAVTVDRGVVIPRPARISPSRAAARLALGA